MKILDEKGRLFGKVSIVDFLIIILILVIIPIFFHIYKILGKTPIRIPSTWVKVEVVTFVLPEILDLFKLGDVSYDRFGTLDAKLIKFVKKDPAYRDKIKDIFMGKNLLHFYNARSKKHIFNISIEYEHKIPVFLELELLCTRSSKNERWHYRREPVLISLKENPYFNFSSDKYSIGFCILRFEDL